jgi:DNA-binding CsgD family transcriptional regulator
MVQTTPSRFVGRDAERVTVETILTAPPRCSTVVTVDGAVGIGKSRLLAELARTATAHGYLVLRGRANQFERGLPFGLLLDALGGADQETDPGALARLAHQLLAAEPEDRGHEPAREIGRLRLYRAVRELIRAAVDRRGVAVFLDDLQWADDATVGFLDHLVLHPLPGQVMVVLAYRTGDCPARLALRLGRSEPAPTHLPLGPLSAVEVDAWLAGTPAGRRRALHAASGGNPLFLGILTDSDTADPTDDRVATAIDTRIGAEVRVLPALERLTAQAAAVIGDGGAPDLVAHAAQLPVDAVVEALDALVRRGLLCEVPGGVAFRHPLVRVAADRTSGALWRRAALDRVKASRAADVVALDGPTPAEPLSDREREVAAMLAEGLSNRAIASRLYLSPRTVESHVARIFAKLGVSTRAAVARHVALAS